ncbi:hypothetical protein BV898_00588 [Hypsibius exemplaris]|uniref:Peptidase M12A domain-containing protein n=1 Tax=Hypsibius exemplaris TaxID=2072580 RepID=A0A1W0XDW2_HYPEX|nr:hypothetical protein BV898_00588 [Hypsibius exemplaris]
MFLIFILIVFVAPYAVRPYVLNVDPHLTKWPGNTVPFILAPGYSQAESNTIRLAAAQFQADMGNCIRFLDLGNGPVPPNTNYVIVSPTGGPGVPAQTCYSYPGRVLTPIEQPTVYGQFMAVLNGPDGCLGSARQVMRFFASVLGLRGEHNKPGRDNFIQIDYNNVSPVGRSAGAFTPYNPSQVFINATDFDYNSITIQDPMTYSTSGMPVIRSLNGRPLYNAGRLSYRDCLALSMVYDCRIQCPTFY